jgi:hypothetical protein
VVNRHEPTEGQLQLLLGRLAIAQDLVAAFRQLALEMPAHAVLFRTVAFALDLRRQAWAGREARKRLRFRP